MFLLRCDQIVGFFNGEVVVGSNEEIAKTERSVGEVMRIWFGMGWGFGGLEFHVY